MEKLISAMNTVAVQNFILRRKGQNSESRIKIEQNRCNRGQEKERSSSSMGVQKKAN